MEEKRTVCIPTLEPVPTVNIPLDEYRAFVEWKVKGPTMEITVEDYKCMKDMIYGYRHEANKFRDENKALKYELANRDTVDDMVKAFGRALEKELNAIKFRLIDEIKKIREEEKEGTEQ